MTNDRDSTASDYLWSLPELIRDQNFRYSSCRVCAMLVRTSMHLGRVYARQYTMKELEQLAMQYGFEIRKIYSSMSNPYQSRYLIKSEIIASRREKCINFYVDNIHDEYLCIREYYPQVQRKWFMNLHMAHEFYHLLEFVENRMTGEWIAAQNHDMPFAARLRSLSEIAAHMFAKTMMHSSVHPKVFDSLYKQELAQRWEEKQLDRHDKF